MSCPHQKECRLPLAIRCVFALVHWQVRYCETDDGFAHCARLVAADQGREVPDGMLPSGQILGAALPPSFEGALS